MYQCLWKSCSNTKQLQKNFIFRWGMSEQPSASAISWFEDIGVMGEFVVFYCADNGYDIKADVGEETTDGAGEGVCGVDDVLFFLSSDGLERCGDGFLMPCLYLYDNENVVLRIVCNDIEVLMSIVPITSEDGIALLAKELFCHVFSPFSEIIVSRHDIYYLIGIGVNTILYFPKPWYKEL